MRRALWVLWLAFLVMMTGCGQSPDPRVIEGHWVAEAFRFESIGLPIGPDLYITQNQLVLGSGKEPVILQSITAEGDSITLLTAVGIDIIFTFESKDRMYFSIPLVGHRIYYNRDPINTAPPASAAYRVVEPPQSTNVQAPTFPSPAAAMAAMPLPSATPASVAPISTDVVVKQVMDKQALVPALEAQYELALQAMRQGDTDAALRSLSAAFADGFSDWQRIETEPLFTELASDVRFQALRSRWKKG